VFDLAVAVCRRKSTWISQTRGGRLPKTPPSTHDPARKLLSSKSSHWLSSATVIKFVYYERECLREIETGTAASRCI